MLALMHSRLRQPERALALLPQMKREGVRADGLTYGALIIALTKVQPGNILAESKKPLIFRMCSLSTPEDDPGATRPLRATS